MKIKPVDNVYLGTQLPRKQKDENMTYYQKNREKMLTKQKEYYKVNREKHLEYAKEYRNRAENKDKIKNYTLDYNKKRRVFRSTFTGLFNMGEGI